MLQFVTAGNTSFLILTGSSQRIAAFSFLRNDLTEVSVIFSSAKRKVTFVIRYRPRYLSLSAM